MSIIRISAPRPLENGISGDEILRRMRARGGITSDGAFEMKAFKEGWAVACFIGRAAHHWRRIGKPVDGIMHGQRIIIYPVLSLCSLRAGPHWKAPLLGPGNHHYCNRCAVKLKKRR